MRARHLLFAVDDLRWRQGHVHAAQQLLRPCGTDALLDARLAPHWALLVRLQSLGVDAQPPSPGMRPGEILRGGSPNDPESATSP